MTNLTDLLARLKSFFLIDQNTGAGSTNGAFSRLVSPENVGPYPFQTHAKGSDRYISEEILALGSWEPFETKIVHRLLPLYDYFLDIGANIGWYTCLAREVMAAGSHVYAFEPDPSNFALLRNNAGKSRTVRLHIERMAVSNRAGTSQLYLSSSNMGDHRLHDSEEGRLGVPVKTTTLDAYFGRRRPTSFLAKLDTQGSEPVIFDGARSLFRPDDRVSSYIVEFWPHGMAGSGADMRPYVSRLTEFGQSVFIMDHQAYRLRKTTWETLMERAESGDLMPATQHFVDLLLVTEGSAAHAAIADLVE